MVISTSTVNNSNVTNVKSSEVFDSYFIGAVKNVSDVIIKSNNGKEALDLSNTLENILTQNKEVVKEKEFYQFYKDLIIKLKFIALPLLGKEEIIELLRSSFTKSFEIEYYNIIEKIETKLLFMIVTDEKDELKNRLKKAILENEEVITPRADKKRINEWLKDYNIKVGIGIADRLKKSQYYVDMQKNKDLSENEVDNLKTLFEFYENLKLSVKTPEGFIKEPPVIVGNRLQIFSKGVLQPVGQNLEKRSPLDPPKIKEESEIDNLEKMAANYELGSLERRAVEEEIRKLKLSIRYQNIKK